MILINIGEIKTEGWVCTCRRC